MTELPASPLDLAHLPENQDFLNLLEVETGNRQSLLRILEEEVKLKGTDDKFLLAKFDDRLSDYKCYKVYKFGGFKQFTISHEGEEVDYEINGFPEKYSNVTSELVDVTIQTSSIPFL